MAASVLRYLASLIIIVPKNVEKKISKAMADKNLTKDELKQE
jgi:hypothetical protein